MKTNLLVAVVFALVGVAGALVYLRLSRSGDTVSGPGGEAFCSTHSIAEAACPWCDPGLVEELGACEQHGVPEALCTECNPKLIAGFKAENDWCAGHAVPESQCGLCKSGQLPPGEKPAGAVE